MFTLTKQHHIRILHYSLAHLKFSVSWPDFRQINIAVTGRVQSHLSVTISAKARTDCIITGLLLIYKYQPPHPPLFLTPTPPISAHTLTSLLSPLFFLSLSFVWKSLPPLHLFILRWRERISHGLRYVNNRWLMDLGYAQILVLLIWQSSDRINIEGWGERMARVQRQFSFFVLYGTINGAVVINK